MKNENAKLNENKIDTDTATPASEFTAARAAEQSDSIRGSNLVPAAASVSISFSIFNFHSQSFAVPSATKINEKIKIEIKHENEK